MSPTRTSSRQAAQKAKEAISDTSEKPATAAKRKGSARKVSAPKRGKKTDQHSQPEVKEEEKARGQDKKPETVERTPKKEKHPPAAKAEGNVNGIVSSNLDLRFGRC